jgi:hypothetical protein
MAGLRQALDADGMDGFVAGFRAGQAEGDIDPL